MILIIRSKADDDTLKKVSSDFDGYIKFVVDIQRKILTAGGMRHSDGEEMLLKDGSRQQNLWGGGLDLETGEIDFDSMINYGPVIITQAVKCCYLKFERKWKKLCVIYYDKNCYGCQRFNT